MLRSTFDRRDRLQCETIEVLRRQRNERDKAAQELGDENRRLHTLIDATIRIADCLQGSAINRKDAATRLYSVVQVARTTTST